MRAHTSCWARKTPCHKPSGSVVEGGTHTQSSSLNVGVVATQAAPDSPYSPRARLRSSGVKADTEHASTPADRFRCW